MFNIITNLSDYPMQSFYQSCSELGYVNNVSRDEMKFDRVKTRFGNYWGLELNKRLVATAGCLEFPEVSPNAFRIQFRGCELPQTDVKKTLSKSHFNSSTFRELIPYQIEWCKRMGSEELYLTTNLDNKNHRAMQLIAKQGYLSLHSEEILFGKEQAIWSFNIDKYITERKKIGRYTIQSPPLI
jgi:hypothetical protein